MALKKILSAVLLVLICQISTLFGQNPPFNIILTQLTIPDLPGIQSYVFGQHEGKWLILGGRIDGLHRRQPFAAFSEEGENKLIYVVDPLAKKYWTTQLTALPISMQEQLCSTNMEYYQDADNLYIIGGYGFSPSIGDHITYDHLTVVNVPATIDAIVNQKNIAPYFRQLTDSMFAVTGGHLGKIYNTFYLVGGQKFTGRYNPMGPDHGPGFTQQYTNQIRKFNLSDDGTTISIAKLQFLTDSVNLHRRDLNVVPQIMPSGEEGLAAFSGVFQYEADLPYQNCVDIDKDGYSTNNSFAQYYNQYHCANIPIYAATKNEMHTVFFGGISRYESDSDTLVQNSDVPFVRTIARVTREANGKMAEYKLPFEMPTLLGSDAGFLEIENLPKYANGVIKLESLVNDTTLIGYIFGGINSSQKNIFWINTGSESTANNQIFKVFLIKQSNLPPHQLNRQSIGSLQMNVATNTFKKELTVRYNLRKSSDVKIVLYNMNNRKLEEKIFLNRPIGENTYKKNIPGLDKGGMFVVTIETKEEKAMQKIISEP